MTTDERSSLPRKSRQHPPPPPPPTRRRSALFKQKYTNYGSLPHHGLHRRSSSFNIAFNDHELNKTLIQISELVCSDIEPSAVWPRSIEAAHQLISCDQINLYVKEEVPDDLVCIASRNIEMLSLQISLKTGGILSYVVKTGQSVNITNVSKDWRFDQETDTRPRITDDYHVIAIPIISKKHIFGVIEAIRPSKANTFNEEEDKLLKFLSLNLSIVFNKQFMSKESDKHRTLAESLVGVTHTTQDDASARKASEKLLSAASQVASTKKVFLLFVDRKTNSLVDSLTGIRIRSTKTLPHEVAFSGQAHATSRFSSVDDPRKTFAEICVPVKDNNGSTIAVLQCIREDTNIETNRVSHFTQRDEYFLSLFAKGAASTLMQGYRLMETNKCRLQKESVFRITELMSTEIATDKLIPKLIELSYRLVDAERITLFLVRETTKNKTLICTVSRDQSFIGTQIKWGEGIVGHVACTAKSLNISNAYRDSRFDQTFDTKTGFCTKGVLCVPIPDHTGRIISVLEAVNKIGSPDKSFSVDDVSALEHLAVSAGLVLRRSQLSERVLYTEKLATSLIKLLKVRISSNSNNTMESVVSKIENITRDVLSCEHCFVYFVSRNKVFTIGGNRKLSLGQGIVGTVAKTGKIINTHNPSSLPSFDHNRKPTVNSVLCIPVYDFHHKHILGVVEVINKKKVHNFDWLPIRGFSHSSRCSSPSEKVVKEIEKDSLFLPTMSPEDLGTPRVAIFTMEDEELLSSICLELVSTLQRYSQLAMISTHEDESVHSLVEMFTVAKPFSPHESLKLTTMISEESIKNEQWPALNRFDSKIKDISTIETFNIFKYNDDQLLQFTIEMIKETGVLFEFELPEKILRNFILEVRRRYKSNPFHCWRHAVGVLHFAYLAIRMTKAKDFLTKLDVLGLLVAALSHDIDHTGHTNAFEVNSMSKHAILHNDNSVLENHHCCTLFSILKKPEFNIFAHFPNTDFRYLRKVIIRAILETDMSKHYDRINELNAFEKEQIQLCKDNEKDRLFSVGVLLHSADLSGQVYPIEVASIWEERISQEFAEQVKEEEALQLPIASFMQNLSTMHHRYKLQVNFMEFVLQPWWEAIVGVFPSLQPCYDGLMKSRSFFRKMSEKYKDDPSL